jgi:predicted Zn-dependent protease
MNAKSRFTIPTAIFALAASLCTSALFALPTPQFNPSRSDEDINAIGHRTIGKNTNFYSPDKEKEIGKALAQEVERSSKLLNDPVVTDYVNRIGQTIAQNSDARYPIVIRVIDSDEPNAFTLPAGYQYVNKGLILQTESEAELAGVLARGIAHTVLRHATRQATEGSVLQPSSIPLMIFTPNGVADYAMYEGLNLAIPLSTLKLRRDTEREADFFGLEYLYKAGYDPVCLPSFLERMSLQNSSVKNIPKSFEPFPPVSERLAAMNKEIAKILPHRDGAIVSTSEFRLIKARLRASQPKLTTNPSDSQLKPTLRKTVDSPTPESPTLNPNCKIIRHLAQPE